MVDSRQPGAQARPQKETARRVRSEPISAYQELLDHVADAILDSTAGGRIFSANSAACEITGYARERLLKMTIRELFVPESGPAVQTLLDKDRETAQRRSVEVQLVAGNGARVDISLQARVKRQHGRIAHVRWIGSDISALKRAREQARYLEDHARAVFQISPDAVAINRLSDGVYVEVNQAFVESTGFAREDLIGVSSLDLGIWPDPAERGHLAAMLTRVGEVHNLQIHFRKKGGQIEAGLMSARVTLLAGEPHILSVTRDLTSWNQARDALKESAVHLEQAQQFGRRLLAAIDHASDEVVIFDKGGSIQYCNPALLRSIGHTREEAIGQNMLFLQFGRQGEEFLERVAVTLREGRAWSGRLSSRKKDGALLVEDATVSPIFSELKDPIGVVAVFRDVTKQLAMETRLQQSQRLESVGRLAGGVAHDFNNLLTVISGYSSLLLMNLSGDSPAWRQVREIQKAGERAAELTQQLLAFSRKQIIRPRPLNLNTVIVDAEPMLRRVLGERNQLCLDLAPDLGPVNCDPGQIHQVLLNLALNSRDAMPEGGRFTIRTRNVEIDAALSALRPESKPGPSVSCFVSDTGTGIAAEIRQQIFEPFFTTKAIGKGTGLGLSTVYGIVRQNGGWIGVESEPGMGTAFTICLPRAASGVAPDAITKALEGPGGSETVLVVEDQEEVLRLAAETLTSQGYRVLRAGSGAAALALASEFTGPIHLLLSDVVMPGMTGRELAERFKVKRPGTAVLLMSGHDPEMAAGRSAKGSTTPFLAKPFTTLRLSAAVREILDRR